MLLHKSFVDPALVFSKDEEEAKKWSMTIRVQQTATGFIMSSSEYQLYWQFDFKRLQHGNDMMYVVQDRGRNVKYIWKSEFANSKDGLAAALQRNNVDVFAPLAVIAIGQQPGDWAALFMTNTTQTAGDFTKLDAKYERMRSDHILMDLVPSMAPMIQGYDDKMALLRQIRTNDSIAALEAQVDLLTTWMAALIPEEFRDQLLEVIASRNKDTKVVFDDMLAFKQRLRTAVGEYQRTKKPS